MYQFVQSRRKALFFASTFRFIVFLLSFSLIFVPSAAQAQSVLNLPIPGAMVAPSPAFTPILLKGMTIHPDNPLQFNFIVDSGQFGLTPEEVKKESEKLVKYFLASMTIPKDDLWVNLSPYEEEKIIPDELGKTELGRDMLAQDYLLKQLTASLVYPEKELGKKFWDKVYQQTKEQFGTPEIPVDTFNKVWIVPETATVYEHNNTVYITDAHLKVMLDSDYQARQTNTSSSETSISKQIIKDVIIPEIEREVNTGKHFAQLRQIYNSLILAKWYKETIKDSLLSQIYADQSIIQGIESGDPNIKDKVYAQYVEAYKKGVFNYIKEDYDRLTDETIPRKYFSGGLQIGQVGKISVSSSPVVDTPTPKYNEQVAVTPTGNNNTILSKLAKKAKKATAIGVMAAVACTGAGCGGGGGSSHNQNQTPPSTEHPGTDISQWGIAELIDALEDASWNIRRDAALELFRRNNQEGIALAKERVVLPEIDRLNTSYDSSPNNESLNRLRALMPLSVAPLQERVAKEGADVNTRKWSLYLLETETGFDEAFSALVPVVTNKDSEILAFAGEHLEMLIRTQPVDQVQTLIDDDIKEVRIAAVHAAEDIGGTDLVWTLQVRLSYESDADVKAAIDGALNALVNIDLMSTWTIEQLREALDSTSWVVEKTAALTIWQYWNTFPDDIALVEEKVVQSRLDMLTNPNDTTRESMPYQELLELEDLVVEPARRTVVNVEANIVVRQWAEDLLEQQLSFDDIFPSLESILMDPDDPFYGFAGDRLQSLLLNLPNALEKSLELVDYLAVPGVRIAAIRTLGLLKDESLIMTLEELVNDSDQDIVNAAHESLNALYLIADLTQWSEERLIEAIDKVVWSDYDLRFLENKPYWIIQRRAAQELFRRDPDSEATNYARQQLVLPRIYNLRWWSTHSGEFHWGELIELGQIAVVPLLEQIQVKGTKSVALMENSAILLGTIGSFEEVNDVLVSITEANGYESWHREGAEKGLDVLYNKQTDNFLLLVLNDDAAQLRSRTYAAKHLGLKGVIGAIDSLESNRNQSTDVDFIATIENSLEQILAQMSVGTYDEVFSRLAGNVLDHEDYFIFRGAVENLSAAIFNQLNSVALSLSLLNHNIAGVRAAAANTLGAVGDSNVISALLAKAEADPSKWVRYYAIVSLGKIGDLGIVDDLKRFRDSNVDANIVTASKQALVTLMVLNDNILSLTNEQLIDGFDVTFKDIWITVTREVFDRNYAQGIDLARERFVWPRILSLTNSEAGPSTKVGQELVKLGPITVTPLIDNVLNNPRGANTNSIKWSARLLGIVGEFDDVIDTLIYVMYDPDNRYASWHETEADRGLNTLYSRQTVGKLNAVLSNDDERIRWRAARELMNRADPASYNALIGALDDSSKDVRRYAALGLGEIGDARALPALENLRDTDPEPDVVTAAETAIQKILSATQAGSPVSTKDVGGIDMNDIDIGRAGGRIEIQFDPVAIREIIDLGIDGFTPVIINFTPLPSVLPLLGLAPQKEEEEFKLSSLD